MNDLDFGGDLRTALRRDADLVGEPPMDLLDQLLRRRQYQRRQRTALVGAIAAVVLVAAGIPVGVSLAARSAPAPATQPAAPTPPVSQDAVPKSPPTTPTVAPPVSNTAASESTAATYSSANPAALVLGPDGLGPLKLGMTRSEAEATGMVEPFRNEPISDRCLWRSKLSGAPAGAGRVFYSETFGVATVDAYAGVQTPEGIGIGSSLAAVAQVYPDFRESDYLRRAYVAVPGNSQLVYRIAYDGAKVTGLTLQYRQQDCYE